MEKVQLNFTERAAQSLNTEAKLQVTTTELYDLYNHPEDMSLFIQIVGNDTINTPDIYIDNVSLKDLRYTLSQLNYAALNNCIIWLKDYDGRVLQEFVTVCESQHNDFAIHDCSFRLCNFSAPYSGRLIPSEVTLICHGEDVVEAYHKIMNTINNH